MVISEPRPMEEILKSLEGEKKVFILGCSGCAESSETGGEVQVLKMKSDLEGQGKEIAGFSVIDFLCNRALIKTRLASRVEEIMGADSLLVMTCGVGVQAVASSVLKVVHPACNTISVNGVPGTWTSEERCGQCGECLLDYTAGICPVTNCSKGLRSGPCGGPSEGMCEVRKDIPCGWVKIYERLEELGKVERMKMQPAVRDFSKIIPSEALRSSDKWAIDSKGNGK